jgi:hypothetical protein
LFSMFPWPSCSTESCFSMHCNEKLWLVMMASDHCSKPFCWHVCIFCKTNVQGTSTNFTGSSAKVQILLGHVYLVLILIFFLHCEQYLNTDLAKGLLEIHKGYCTFSMITKQGCTCHMNDRVNHIHAVSNLQVPEKLKVILEGCAPFRFHSCSFDVNGVLKVTWWVGALIVHAGVTLACACFANWPPSIP